MTAVPSSPVGAGPGEATAPAGLGPAPAGPAGIDPSARETIEEIVQAVRDGNDAAIRTLLTDLAAVVDTAALLYLRERLYATQ
ncbi:hypothetical protein [Streptomyces sp. NBC_00162]|uniref:hypothetical protein n=1 Tax=Streptomyces sp. NBC_00162 TaxID=2903629 RepID=UPI00214B0172|nr:hypothetical protein [Streptomyces sp. NBC_00162]UUU37709.1 hypothetical protein JIW86_01545 [Streptomyces sp. NBC_00162]